MVETYVPITNVDRGSTVTGEIIFEDPFPPDWYTEWNYPYHVASGALEAPGVPSLEDQQIREYEPLFETQKRSKPEDPVQSWYRIRKSGLIKMTSYYHHSKRVENFLASVEHHRHDYKRLTYPSRNGGAAFVRYDRPRRRSPLRDFVYYAHFGDKLLHTESKWTEQGDLAYWSSVLPHYKMERVEEGSQATRRLEALKLQTINDNFTSYDFLTDLGELRSTVDMMLSLIRGIARPLRTYKTLRDKILTGPGKPTTNALAELSNAWLSLQYGILPTMYSVQDAMATWENRNSVYQTTRNRFQMTGKQPRLPAQGSYIYDSGHYHVKWNITGKSRHTVSGLLRTYDRTGINILRTSWELIPYSLIVDWFVDVGSFLEAQLQHIGDLAEQRKFCYSRKIEALIETRLHLESEFDTWYFPPIWADWTGRWWGELLPSGGPLWLASEEQTYSHPRRIVTSALLRRTRIEDYDRVTFSPSDIELTWNPNLSWKRWVSGAALSFNKLNNALRRLR